MNNKIAYKDMSYRERREYHNQKQREYKARYPEKTKQVRGLLCPYCNTLLGYAKDSDMVLMKAIKYIKENQYPEKDRDIVRQLANEMEEKFINTFYIRKDEDLKP